MTKIIFYTIPAIILDILIWSTVIFIIFICVPAWINDKDITVLSWVSSIVLYLFFEGLRLYIINAYEFMKDAKWHDY